MTPAEAMQADLADVKAHLKMAYVLEHYGHTPETRDGNGKLHYYSPFREDNRPSFDVFSYTIKGRTSEEERFGDFADPDLNQGDVVDLVAKFEQCTVSAALSTARELLAAQITVGWEGPTVERSQYRVIDMTEVQYLVDNARPLSQSQTWFALPRTHPGLTEVVLPSDRVFLHPSQDIIVFLFWDDSSEIRGVRFRDSAGHKYSVKGSHNVLMRMEAPSQKPVFLTEGETDAWAAYGALSDKYEVMGVPGVSTPPEKAGGASLAGRTVYVSFDPDKAGAKGRSIWASYLSQLGCDVRTIVLPDGKDIASLHPEAIRRLPERARYLPPRPDKIGRLGDTFVTISISGRGDDAKETYEAKSNWAFEATSILVGESGDRAYKGILSPSGRTVTLPDTALQTATQLKLWGKQYQAYWYGSDPQVQQLAALLAHESAYIAEGRVHNQVGLHEGSFVWPGGYIGDQPVEYVPTVAEAKLGPDQIFIKQEPVNSCEVFWALFNAQHPAVTGPLLAWLAAAPLRTRYNQFPILNVTGASGSGKSALTEEFLRVFSSVHMATTLSSTTPHAVATQIDNSNGFPVWFDEYRPGAKAAAKDTIDQLIRDAYTMQDSAKGGQDRGNLSKLAYIRTAAPLIISGEDSFTETSHTDRMVLLRLKQVEQGNLGVLQDLDIGGFAFDYLSYLASPHPHDPDSTPPVRAKPLLPHTDLDLRPRQKMNAQVLLGGWDILMDYLTLCDPTFSPPELDLSRVVDAGVEAGASNPVIDLVINCLENDTMQPTVWRYNGFLCIHVQNLIDEAKHHPTIVLPVSNAKGLKELLMDQHHASAPINTRVPSGLVGSQHVKQVKAIRIPESTLDWLHNEHEDDSEDH